ncbi:HypC/HybG/HupF family hydrogenase formation chaperone [candidate division WOR-3 bacterium]|nr:HypC/HybG/HupF family hydrogenase formation chaperone [candidate division WOR-3 bacterium]
MCLGIPVKIVEKKGKTGIAEIGGVKREIDLRLVEDAEIGDYVILHAGFAIQKLDEKEAQETLDLIREIL